MAKNNDSSIKKYYAVNHDSTAIFVTTTADESKLSPDVLKTFERASVLFAAISTAISKAGMKLFDFDAYNKLLGQSGNFTAMTLEKKTFQHTSGSLALNMSIIEGVIGAAIAPEEEFALAAVITAIGGELNASTATDKSVTKIAKAMLWIEEIMGVPDISVQLWYIDRSESKNVTVTDCSKTTVDTIKFEYNTQEFTFVDPTWIAKFAGDFKSNPDFQALIDRFTKILKPDAK